MNITNSDMIDAHFGALTFAYPVCNSLILVMIGIGAIRAPTFRPAFIVLALAVILLLIPQAFTALLKVQKQFHILPFPKPIFRPFMPYVFAANWLAFPVDLIGVVLLVRQSIKANETAPNQAVEGTAR